MVMATALLVSMGKEDKSSSGGADTSDSGPAAWEEVARSELTPETSGSMCSQREDSGAHPSVPAQHGGLGLSHLPFQGPALGASPQQVSAQWQTADWHSASETEPI